jgi:hypothetical protein
MKHRMSNEDYEAAVASCPREVLLTAEENAYDTMVERYGRTPGTMSDPMWEEWNWVAYQSAIDLGGAQ